MSKTKTRHFDYFVIGAGSGGVRSARIAATHGVLCGPARERLAAAPVEEIVLTDTIPVDTTGLDRLVVLRTAPLLAEAIMRVHTEQSLSVLFKRPDDNPAV